MPKSIHQHENEVLTLLLKEMRLASGMLQADVAQALGRSQSHISDIENGTRRLDLIQLREYCAIFDTTLIAFVRRFEKSL
ncbi:helix-turn-helix domain-containing protein [Lysobacter silvisoli]|uniref:XRE family transcriptional regulator n=1 Tax=Lysobacter silvisoli TaxID=2293254 RepID=A0A371JWM6_9GAMM|nr:helix-turn-helix transcriptional regulator [Lysobacter silvisoli]RDZ26014.1 XRE family transcriptional regulator [Lysobacter silvisoli]